MDQRRQAIIPRHVQRRVKNSLLYLFLFLVFIISVIGLYRGGIKLVGLKPEQITIKELPYALMLSLIRMSVSYAASLVFAFILGMTAARTRWGERVIIPLLDILQSVPVVGFFPVAIGFFIAISGGHRIGIEMAATFLIFTSQAWNLAFAVYESIKSIPSDQVDAVMSLGITGSQRFWRLFAPACAPRLVYNSILSWSNGWFFLVACEIIAVGPISYHLPGIGSFLARAAEQDRTHLVFWGLFALMVLILALDFLFWRPTSDWAEKFKYEQSGPSTPHEVDHFSIQHVVLSRVSPIFAPASRLFRALFYPLVWSFREVALPLIWDLPGAFFSGIWKIVYADIVLKFLQAWTRLLNRSRWIRSTLIWTSICLLVTVGFYYLVSTFFMPPWPEITRKLPLAVLTSTARLIVALTLSMCWILPITMLTWNKPRARRWLTTIAQVGASLPAIALFPLIIILIVKKFGGGMELASILLLVMGMQWYPLFNCLGGTASIPSDIADATLSMGLGRFQIWRRLVFPAIRPALITGCITAWGGGWNALVVSEYVRYKSTTLSVNGIGALLSQAVYDVGDQRAMVFCVAAMVGWIIAINLMVWQPLYRSSIARYKFDV